MPSKTNSIDKQTGRLMRGERQKVLICGYGSMGKKYHELITNNWNDVKIVILSSQNLEYLKDARTEVEGDIESTLNKNCTHAIVANAATLHVDYASILLETGINTLIEKPLLTDQDLERQIETLIKIKNKEKAFVGYVLRQDKIVNWNIRWRDTKPKLKTKIYWNT